MKTSTNHLRGVAVDLLYILTPPTIVLVLHILRQLIWPLAIEFDMLAHLLGGFSVAAAAARFFQVLKRRKIAFLLPPPLYRFIILAIVALIGVLWEFQEWVVFNTLVELPPYLDVWTDTISDLLLDLLGAAAWIVAFTYRKKS